MSEIHFIPVTFYYTHNGTGLESAACRKTHQFLSGGVVVLSLELPALDCYHLFEYVYVFLFVYLFDGVVDKILGEFFLIKGKDDFLPAPMVEAELVIYKRPAVTLLVYEFLFLQAGDDLPLLGKWHTPCGELCCHLAYAAFAKSAVRRGLVQCFTGS